MSTLERAPIRLILGLAASACLVSACTRHPTAEVENLRAFAKLYGYVRFFHPSDEAAALDWERFAVHGAMRAREARSVDELETILTELFRPVAPTAQIYRT
ncbi:MAG: hypothetical protein PVI01_05180, partial [Gemmatimonadales bacterium]